jgi:hypothetical protein
VSSTISFFGHDPQSPGPSASLVETEETPEKIEGGPEGDIQMEYSCD